jgi:hypothetical protein
LKKLTLAAVADQRPARVAGIDRRLRLDDVDLVLFPFEIGTDLADQALGIRPGLPLGMADRVDIGADLRLAHAA